MGEWVVAMLALLGTVVGGGDEDPQCLLLGGLDSVRVAAFSEGRAERLLDVYADDRLLAADAALLDSYHDRGLRLRGGGLERLSCRVARATDGVVELDVVDRLGRTWVLEGDRSRELPRGSATRRTVTLERAPDGWRVTGSR